LSEILNVFYLRACRQILTRRGILPLQKSVPAIKIILLSMFFSETLKSLAFLINEANVSEPKIYPEILKELKRRRIIKTGDVIYADRGYYSYENYVTFIRDFKLVPLIFPRKTVI